jgi:hypothetical protein
MPSHRASARCSFLSVLLVVSLPADITTLQGAEPLRLGNQRQLFVDQYLIDTMTEGVSLQVQRPEPREVVLVTGEPWEGNTSAYYTILQDTDDDGSPLYRMYYRGSHAVNRKSAHEEVTCYAESRDGRRWNKPRLGLFDWEGSTDNNIVWRGIGTHCFAPFIDNNPHCPPEARYKALSRGRPVGQKGLYTYQSADGIHWKLSSDAPVITSGAFDSQNLGFWDPVLKQYVAYSRLFTNGVRAIQRSTSDDFVTWSDPVVLTYPGAPNQHLYTNAIRPCPGAPHIRIGFPTRYLPGTQQVEPVFMASRDGLTFARYDTAIIPQSAPQDRDGNRSNYMAHGLLSLPDFPEEWSVYATEAYYEGPDSRLRRFVYRKEGLVALAGTGEMLTKPILVTGDTLLLNSVCAAGGSIHVEVCDASGNVLPAWSRDDMQPITADHLNQQVRFNKSDSLSSLKGRTARFRLVLDNASVFAFQLAN